MTLPVRPGPRSARILLALIVLTGSAVASRGQDEEKDGLPGASAAPTRAQIEALLRDLGRDPVTPELVDRIDALYRPKLAPSRKLDDLKASLADPAFVARLDALAKDLTGKPADSRTLIYRAVSTGPSEEPATVLESMRDDLEREAAPRKTIRGRVIDAETNRPIAGAVISVFSGMETRTDAQGEYVLKFRKVRGPTQMAVYVEAPGHALTATTIEWTTLGESQRVDFRMPKEVWFRGRVIDTRGKPIEGVELELMVPPGTVGRPEPSGTPVQFPFSVALKTRTDAQGNWAFRGVGPEVENVPMAHWLSASHPNYRTRQKGYQQNELLGPGWEITLEPGCVLEGEVVDQEGKPVAGAEVTIQAQAASGLSAQVETTDAAGKFRAANLPEAAILVTARPKALLDASANAATKAGAVTRVKIVAKDGEYLAGRVVGDDGKPVANATVGWVQRVLPGGGAMVVPSKANLFLNTGEDGKFRLGPVEKGRYKITGRMQQPNAIGFAEAETGGAEIVIELKKPQ